MFFFRDYQDTVLALRNALRQRRAELRLRQVDLAQQSGVPLATLNLFERTGKISLESFAKLLLALKLDEQVIEALRKTHSPEPATMKEFLASKPKRRVDLPRRRPRQGNDKEPRLP